MTRIEQLAQKANALCNDPKNDYKSTEDLCFMMAEWCDAHPDNESFNKRLKLEKEEWLDKAIEWLYSISMFDIVYKYDNFDMLEYWDKFIEDFKEYMEE